MFEGKPLTNFNGYKLNTTAIGNGVVSADKSKGYFGESATLYVSAGPNYTYSGMEVDVGQLSGLTYVFGRGDATLSAYFRDSSIRYVILEQGAGGTVTATPMTGMQYDEVTLSANSNPHYTFNAYSITGATLTGNKFTFGTSDVTAKGSWIEDPRFTAYFKQTSGGKLSGTPATGYSGDVVTLVINPSSHYSFVSANLTGATLTGNTFAFDGSDVSAEATWLQDPIYSATLIQNVGGRISAVPLTGFSGDIITLSNTPSSNYTFSGYSITGGSVTGNNVRFENSNLIIEGNFVQDEYNPLNLPPNTVRVRTSDGNAPIKNSPIEAATYETASLVAGTNNVYDVYKSGTNLNKMFACSTNVVAVLGANTKDVTNMSEMFYGCENLTSVVVFDTTKVTSMEYMFRNCYNLTTVPSFDTSSVTTMKDMFGECYELTSVPLFNTSNVTSMDSMFELCRKLTSVPLFDTTKVTNMRAMLWGCSSLTSVPLFNTSNVTSMNSMLGNCSTLTGVPLFETSAVTDMKQMFFNCDKITTVPLLNTSKVTDMEDMFYSCDKLVSVPVFNTSKVTNMYDMFCYCSSLSAVPLFNTSKVTNMGLTFFGCENVQTGALALYQQASTQTNPPSNHEATFYNCGINTQTGAAELAQIPSNWK